MEQETNFWREKSRRALSTPITWKLFKHATPQVKKSSRNPHEYVTRRTIQIVKVAHIGIRGRLRHTQTKRRKNDQKTQNTNHQDMAKK